MTEEEYIRMKNLLNTVIEQQASFAENQRKADERQRRNDEGIAALLSIAELHEQEISTLNERMEKMNERMDKRFAEIADRFREIGEKTAETDDRINALVNVVERYISKN